MDNNIKIYWSWASNPSGATTDVADSRGNARFTSLSAAVNGARQTMGPGWTIHVMCSYLGDAEEVKVFTRR